MSFKLRVKVWMFQFFEFCADCGYVFQEIGKIIGLIALSPLWLPFDIVHRLGKMLLTINRLPPEEHEEFVNYVREGQREARRKSAVSEETPNRE